MMNVIFVRIQNLALMLMVEIHTIMKLMDMFVGNVNFYGEVNPIKEKLKKLYTIYNGIVYNYEIERCVMNDKIEVVCLCGSSKFKDEFIKAQRDLSLDGKLVISLGLFGHIEGLDMDSDTKKMLDKVHFKKIDMSDSIYVINKGGYIGESTRNQINYAEKLGKQINYLVYHEYFSRDYFKNKHKLSKTDVEPLIDDIFNKFNLD